VQEQGGRKNRTIRCKGGKSSLELSNAAGTRDARTEIGNRGRYGHKNEREQKDKQLKSTTWCWPSNGSKKEAGKRNAQLNRDVRKMGVLAQGTAKQVKLESTALEGMCGTD